MLRLIPLFFTLFLFMPCLAQDAEEMEQADDDKKSRVSPFLFAGVTAGGNVDRGNVVYKDGWTVNGGLAWRKSKRVYLGLTGGVERLGRETFLPAGVSVLGYTRKKDETMLFGLHAGYAHGFNESLYSLVKYSFQGGLFFQPFLGFKTEVNGTHLMLTAGYKLQFSGIRYYAEETYREENAYHLLSLRAGVLF